MKKLLCAWLFIGAACVPQPVRRDPYAVLEADAQPVLAGVSAALILSDNAKQALDFARAGQSRGAGFDAEALFEQGLLRLKGQFKSLVKAESLSHARARGVELVVVLDVFVQAERRFRIEQALIFTTPDGREIEKLTARAERSLSRNSGQAVRAATEETTFALLAGMRASVKLAQFGQKAGAPAAAPAALASASRPVSPLERPGYKRPEDPRAYAVIVGVENYESLTPAQFAERDAAAAREHARALGVPDRNLIYLTGSRAGRAAMEKYLEAWLPKQVEPDSSVFFYFSGHGAPDTRSGEAYLMPWDGDAKFLENTAYPVRRLYKSLNALKAKRLVVALDSCFSGAGGRSVLPAGVRPLVARVETASGDVGRIAVLTASAGDEISGSDAEQGHGLFTYHLLRGLSAKGGRAVAKELHAYLLPKVRDAARRDNRDQTPQLLGAADAALGGDR